jgi:hypothetical protein
MSDMKGVGKAFKYGVLALTFASLVGIQLPAIADAAESRRLKLDDLAVAKSAEDSKAKREAAEKQTLTKDAAKPPDTPPPVPPGPPSGGPTPLQEEALREFARQAVACG